MRYWSASGDSKPTFDEAIKHLNNGDETKELDVGHMFGPSWSNHWVKVDIRLPQELTKSDQQVICE